MERLHAIISWSDPYATGMFVAGCIAVALIIAVLSWPLVQATAVCFLVRPVAVLSRGPCTPQLRGAELWPPAQQPCSGTEMQLSSAAVSAKLTPHPRALSSPSQDT